MLTDEQRKRLAALANAQDMRFTVLVELAGLDPARSFRGADLRGVDFAGCNLAGYDFSDADLTGASFRRAALSGLRHDRARLDDVRWPQQRDTTPRYRNRLAGRQMEAAAAMIRDLAQRGKALAIMPTGSGRLGVLEEVIATTFDGPDARAILIVSSAVERDIVTHRLRKRLPHLSIGSLKELQAIHATSGILVLSQFGMGARLGDPLRGTPWEDHVEAIYSTSTERLARGLGSLPYADHVRLAATDAALFEFGRSDIRQQAGRVRKIFGQPSYELTMQQVLDSGDLVPARLVVPYPGQEHLLLRRAFPFGRYDERDEEHYRRLDSATEALLEVRDALRFPSALVLCGDDRQARRVRDYLTSFWRGSGQMSPVGQRWSAPDIERSLEEMEGLLVSPVTRQSVDAAGRVQCVALLTDLKLEYAQDVAFRRWAPSNPGKPLVLDMAGALRGFPDLEFGLDGFMT